MPTQFLKRRDTTFPALSGKPHAVPIYVDSDDSIIKFIPAGSGTTEVQVVDTATDQTITGAKTFTGDCTFTKEITTLETFADGTAAAPSISFASDTNSGIYWIGADNIGIALGGAIEWNLSTTALSPGASNGSALGTTALMWSDLFLADGGVINFNNGNTLLTHAAGQLTLTGSFYLSNAAGPALMDEAATSTNPTLIPDKAETDTGIGWVSDTLHIVLGGVNAYAAAAASLSPGVTNAAALGTTALMWSDLFLADGAVVNFNDGNATITHSTGLLTLGSAGLSVGASGAGYDVTFYGDIASCNFLWDQDLDTNGGLQLGADTKSVMFYAYGATTGNYLKWDAANDDLLLVGTATQLGVAGTTASSSTATGSIHTAGGLGVAGATYVGGLVSSAGGFVSSAQTLTPDATRTYIAYQVGNRVTEKDITMVAAADQNLDPVQLNLNIIGAAPTNTSTLNGVYQQITHDTTDMPNLRLKGCDWTITTDKTCTDAYVVQTELIVSGTKTSGGELMAMSALTTLGTGARTADRVLAFQAMISGSGTAGTVVGDCFVAYLVNAGTVITTDSICCVHNQSAATATSALELDLDGTVTYAFDFDGTVADAWTTADGVVTQADEYVKIPVRVAGVTPTLYLLAAETWA